MTDRETNELEKIITDALAKAGMTDRVYETDWLPEELTIFWQGGSLDEFLRLAALTEPKFLYLVRLWTAANEDYPSEHAGQVYELDAAFHHHDHFHVFRLMTPWGMEYWKGYDGRNVMGTDRGGREAYS